MTWNPKRARAVLDASPNATFIRAVDKLSAYAIGPQTIALADQNLEQVSIYSTAAPAVEDVVLTRECSPATVKRRGRHAALNALHPSLGWDRRLYLLEIRSEGALERLVKALRTL